MLIFFGVLGVVAIAAGIGGIYFVGKKKRNQSPKTAIEAAKSAFTLSACVDLLKNSLHIQPFNKDITQNLEQVERFYKKRATINQLLEQKFSVNEMSFDKFCTVLDGVENVVYINLRSIINKISAFDYEEYVQLDRLEWSNQQLKQEKLEIYQKYIDFVDEATDDNEEIILKLDKLLLEITHFSDVSQADIMSMPAIAELDKLIKNAKLYR